MRRQAQQKRKGRDLGQKIIYFFKRFFLGKQGSKPTQATTATTTADTYIHTWHAQVPALSPKTLHNASGIDVTWLLPTYTQTCRPCTLYYALNEYMASCFAKVEFVHMSLNSPEPLHSIYSQYHFISISKHACKHSNSNSYSNLRQSHTYLCLLAFEWHGLWQDEK